MEKIFLEKGWKYRRIGENDWMSIAIPHDALITEKRTKDSDGGVNTGWFEGYDYEYEYTLTVPEEYKDKVLTLEFEGVYRDAEVYINGEKAAYRPYGYTNFYIAANDFLKTGENIIRVLAKNSDQPNSRWYSGAGIYRPVYLYVQDKAHILINGVKIRTLSIDPAKVEVIVKTSSDGELKAEVFKDNTKLSEKKASVNGGECTLQFEIENAKLWSVETPELYTLKLNFGEEKCEEKFGIRTVSCTPEEGFAVNGKRVIIRGACIHSDNGILGARCYKEAEERKIRILKENGYNAIRSAHNPISKATLEACDKIGMMILDEYCDMWYIHKNRYDYATHLEEWYERDITDMVEKDFNHPSVIMYSFGNEVAETGEKRGIELFKKMKAVCKKYDDRPVTTGVNIFFNYLYALGFGQYSDKKAEKKPTKKVGSEFFNNLAGIFGDGFMKTMAKLPGCDRKTRDCFAEMDAAGYNYGIKRYKHDLKKYPKRIILGSETFCSDAYSFWETAKSNKRIIGDFVWAGMDYLGEVGVGSWEYREYAPDFLHGVGWLTAGSGRINLIGESLGEALYTKVAFELCDKPQIAVVPVSHTNDKHSPSAWKFSNAIPSWSWNGLDGKKAKVEVYSRAPIVELYINGKKAGRKKFKKNCRFDFKTKYYGGEITAVNLDKKGKELSRNTLKTAGDETLLSVLPENKEVNVGEVCFVRLRYTDGNGNLKPLERGIIDLEVEGGELLAAGSACPFNTIGFNAGKTDTYYGEALAAIKAQDVEIKIKASDGKLNGEATINVK